MATATASNPFETTATAGGSGSYDLIPAGSYPAVLVGLIDLGTHDDEFKGKAIEKRTIAMVWELTGEIKPDGNPHCIAKDFSAYFSPSSKVRALIEGWRGKKFTEGEKFNYSVLLGKPCLVNVTHKKTSSGKEVHEVNNVSGVPRGMTVPRPHHEPVIYTVGDGPPPDLEWLPYIYGESVADIVRRSKEMTGKPITSAPAPASPSQPAGDQGDDEVPF